MQYEGGNLRPNRRVRSNAVFQAFTREPEGAENRDGRERSVSDGDPRDLRQSAVPPLRRRGDSPRPLALGDPGHAGGGDGLSGGLGEQGGDGRSGLQRRPGRAGVAGAATGRGGSARGDPPTAGRQRCRGGAADRRNRRGDQDSALLRDDARAGAQAREERNSGAPAGRRLPDQRRGDHCHSRKSARDRLRSALRRRQRPLVAAAHHPERRQGVHGRHAQAAAGERRLGRRHGDGARAGRAPAARAHDSAEERAVQAPSHLRQHQVSQRSGEGELGGLVIDII